MILAALDRSPLFISAALPLKVVPPLFNRYEGGETYGNHIDGAIYPIAGTPHRVRTDLSATLFLSAPEDYEGGALVADDTYGAHRVKLPAGDMILYPGTSLHRIEPVTRGVRLAAFFWVQSMVRADAQRALLFDLDTAIQSLSLAVPDDPALAQLTGVYHNLLRQWADT
jgi:PKHD-type hydroxylase